MKGLLVLIVVLWAGVGWAEDCALKRPGYSPEIWPCVSHDKAKQTVQTLYYDGRPVAECMDKMEAAMRAMERSVAAPAPSDVWYQSWVAVIDRRQWEQWTEAKACWRKP